MDGRVWEALHVAHALRPVGASSTWCTTTSTGCRWRSRRTAAAPLVTTIHGFSDPRILPAYRSARLGVRVDLRRRPGARSWTTSRRSTTASTSRALPFSADAGEDLVDPSAGSIPTRAPPRRSTSPGAAGAGC